MRMSIRSKILLGLLLFFIPAYLLLIGVFTRGLTLQKEQVLAQHLNTAEALAIAAESFVNNKVTVLKGAADRIAAEPRDAQRALAAARRLDPGFASLGIIGADRKVLAQLPLEVNPSLLRAPVSSIEKAGGGADFAVSGVRQIGDIFGFNIVVRVPPAPEDSPQDTRFVTGFVRDTVLGRAMAIRVGQAGNIGIIDSSGRALVLSFLRAPSFEERDRRFIGSIRRALRGETALNQGFVDPVDGVRRIGATAPVPTLGWATNVFEPEEQALASQRRVAVLDAVLLLVLLGVATAVAWLAATRLVRPIEELARASESVAAGKFDQRVEVHTGDELEEAAASFNRMAIRIKETIESERRVADLLRETLLPTQLISVPGLQMGVAQGAASERYRLGGDFYVAFRIGSGKAGVIIGDITGKGMPAAALALKARYILASQLSQGRSPSQSLAHLNHDLCLSLPLDEQAIEEEPVANKFVTAIALIVDLSSGKVTIANGGHPQPLLCGPAGCDQLAGHGPIIGVFPEAEFGETEVALEPGSTLVLVTDGVTEARRIDPLLGRSSLFGERRFVETVTEALDMTPQGLADSVFSSVLDHSEGRLSDDTVVLVLRIAEESSMPGAA